MSENLLIVAEDAESMDCLFHHFEGHIFCREHGNYESHNARVITFLKVLGIFVFYEDKQLKYVTICILVETCLDVCYDPAQLNLQIVLDLILSFGSALILQHTRA